MIDNVMSRLENMMVDVHNDVQIDEACFCDGTDDGYYVCSYPPCVAKGEAEAAFYARQFASAAAKRVADSAAYDAEQLKADWLVEYDKRMSIQTARRIMDELAQSYYDSESGP